jgi:Arc/MetJ-type ribon-helix-helix transcriptional regulator
VKVSVSLPDDDVDFVDQYAHRRGSASRSSVIHHAIELLRATELEDAYADAWDEWQSGGEEAAWSATTDNGIAHATR